MRRIIFFVLLTACSPGYSDDPETTEALWVCTAYCTACAEIEIDECVDVCMSQWSTFAGQYDDGKAECAERYLTGRECQATMGCDDLGCGDPVADMYRCAELADPS